MYIINNSNKLIIINRFARYNNTHRSYNIFSKILKKIKKLFKMKFKMISSIKYLNIIRINYFIFSRIELTMQ